MVDRDSYQMLLAETQGILSNANHICTYIPDSDTFGNFAHIFQSQESSIEVGAPLNSAVMLSGVFNATGGTRPAVVLNAALGASPFTQSQVQQVAFNTVTGAATMLDGLGNSWAMTPGDSAATVQTAARANGNANYAAVVVSGSSAAYVPHTPVTNPSHAPRFTFVGSGDNLVNGVWKFAYTWVDAYGETQISPILSWTQSGGPGPAQIGLDFAADAGAVSVKLYISDAVGSSNLVYSTSGTLANFITSGGGGSGNGIQAVLPLPGAAAIPAANTTGAPASGGNGTYLFTFPGGAGNQPTIGSNNTGVSGRILVQGGVVGNRNIITATGSGTSVDNTVATTTGYTINLNAINVAGTTPSMTIIFEDSADNAAWATVATFAAITAKGAQRLQSKTATVRRYSRVRWTVTGTLPQFAVNVSMSRFGDIVST